MRFKEGEVRFATLGATGERVVVKYSGDDIWDMASSTSDDSWVWTLDLCNFSAPIVDPGPEKKPARTKKASGG